MPEKHANGYAGFQIHFKNVSFEIAKNEIAWIISLIFCDLFV